MYLVAQHVLSPAGRGEGVNAFCYLHGPDLAWLGVPPEGIPGQNPGVLTAQLISVAPPGNRVRSYLDVIAPDETPQAEIRQSFVTFVSHAQRERFTLPMVGWGVPLLEHAVRYGEGEGGLLFRPWTNVRRDLAEACARAGIARVSP
jgi:hypothetical protein